MLVWIGSSSMLACSVRLFVGGAIPVEEGLAWVRLSWFVIAGATHTRVSLYLYYWHFVI
jgi:hypothetical protein